MFKRFFDTDIWQKKWFRALSQPEKNAWWYILSHCDNVGVWISDTEMADFFIGTTINWDVFLNSCNGNIVLLDSGKYWVKDFCFFQYGVLTPSCKAHTSYIKLLHSYDLFDSYLDTVPPKLLKGTPYESHTNAITIPYQRGQDKDQEQDKVKDKDKEQEEVFKVQLDTRGEILPIQEFKNII